MFSPSVCNLFFYLMELFEEQKASMFLSPFMVGVFRILCKKSVLKPTLNLWEFSPVSLLQVL